MGGIPLFLTIMFSRGDEFVFEIGAEEEEDFGVVDPSANLNDNSATYNTQQVCYKSDCCLRVPDIHEAKKH